MSFLVLGTKLPLGAYMFFIESTEEEKDDRQQTADNSRTQRNLLAERLCDDNNAVRMLTDNGRNAFRANVHKIFQSRINVCTA